MAGLGLAGWLKRRRLGCPAGRFPCLFPFRISFASRWLPEGSKPKRFLRNVSRTQTLNNFNFFQRQSEAHCGMHALNNALQQAAFAPEEMGAAAVAYLEEHLGVDDAAEEHIGRGGWYSAQVLYSALFLRGYVLDLDAYVRSLPPARQAGACVQNWGNRHWVAYRLEGDGSIWLLDSLEAGPIQQSEVEFLDSLAAHPTYVVLNSA